MGYKQKSFPMHQGTSSHTSALKQGVVQKGIDVDEIRDDEVNKADEVDSEKSWLETSTKKAEENIEKDIRSRIKNINENVKSKINTLKENITAQQDAKDTRIDTKDKTAEENRKIRAKRSKANNLKNIEKKQKKAETTIQGKLDKKDAKKALKDKNKAELKAEKEKGKTARKTEKHLAKIKKAGETVEQRKARRKANRDRILKNLDPVFQAMNEPISVDASGYFPQETEKQTEDKGKQWYQMRYEKDKNKILEKRIKELEKGSNEKSSSNSDSKLKLKGTDQMFRDLYKK